MTDSDEPMTREQLLADFDRDWDALQHIITSANPDDLLACTDAAGWNSRDHLAHLSAWLNSVIVMIRDGEEQWTGTGAPKELFNHDDYDLENEAIRQLTIDWSVADVQNQLREHHESMMGIVRRMTDDDLQKSVSVFVPGEADSPIAFKINGNGPQHYREHTEYIQKILNDCRN